MKRSKSKNGAREWVHIQCALWIPEVTMGDPEKMSDPDISNIPESRMWQQLTLPIPSAKLCAHSKKICCY